MELLTKAGQTIHSVHDADGNRIAEYDYDPIAQSSTLLREYVWMNGMVVAVTEGGAVYYARTDRHHKAERLHRAFQLPGLLGGVATRILWIGLKLRHIAKNDLQLWSI